MKKIFTLALLSLLLMLLVGCSEDLPNTETIGQADNEILTYKKIDSQKTPLLISKTGNIYLQTIFADFESQNPDIQIIEIDITGGTQLNKPYLAWIKNGLAPDLMFISVNIINDFDNIDQYFVNLSGSPILTNFQTESLNRIAINEQIYLLPGPSELDCMIYNKTLFEQYGWEIPKTFDQFVELCRQIREDSKGTIEAWNPNAKYDTELNGALEAMIYAELFGGVENRTWYNDFIAGEADFAEHMRPLYEVMQKLIDQQIVREEHFTYSATSRLNEFLDGKIAMINSNASKNFGNSNYKLGLIPFPSTIEGEEYLLSDFSCSLAMPKKEQPPEIKEAAEKFLSYFSEPRSQQVFIGDKLMISSVNNVPTHVSEYLDELQPSINAGRMFSRLDFKSEGQTTNFSFYKDFLALVKGETTVSEALAAVDKAPYIPQQEPLNNLEIIATAAQDFTILETSNYLADFYREKTGADLALIANNIAFRGNLMRIFAGDLNSSDVEVLKPRSLANDSQLVKVKMTGQQLLAALNNPPDYENRSANCTYAFSGLKCTVAPWRPLGQKMLSVALSDGTPIDENQEYTVAIWEGTVFDSYISEVLESYPGTFEELLTEKLKADQTIAPAQDGRITLVWD